jgi:hypothetical protein
MRTIKKTIYKFAELSDRAKERARDWYRGCIESSDYDSVIEDAARIADILGINLRTRAVKLMGGGTRFDPCIWWSGFSSQGDGTLTIIKEKSPTSFEVEQNLQTMPGAKTLTLDSKTNHILLIAAEFGPPPAPPAQAGPHWEDSAPAPRLAGSLPGMRGSCRWTES